MKSPFNRLSKSITSGSLSNTNKQILATCSNIPGSFQARLLQHPSATQSPLNINAKPQARRLSSSPISPAPPSNRTTTSSSTMPLQIRPLESTDKEIWLSLWEQYNQFYKRTIPADVTSTTFARFLDTSVRMYCAVAVDPDTSKVIAFITWYPHFTTSSIQEIVYIQDLFVDPSVRNKGAGRTLIEHVYEHAKTIPVNSVYWNTQYYNYVGQILYNKVATRTDFVRWQKNF